jgi:predicted dehydrogenase/nucleoside-diphosphate-sugar epimerase
MTPSEGKNVQVNLSQARLHTGAKKRVALLGAGYISDWHALALGSVDGVELVAVCDRFRAKAEALAQKFGVPRVYDSLESLLAGEPALDAIHILLPPDRHFEAARAVLEAGVNVFLEKPMCDRAEDCDALVQLAAERGLRLSVGHNFLFAEVYERLRTDVQSGVLGLIDDVTITWHRPLPQAQFGPFDAWMLRDPKNIMIEVGSHSVAHMLDLVGEPDAGEPEVLDVRATNGLMLPTGVEFYRRWQVSAHKGRTAVDLRFSFVPGFAEYTIHVRGSLAAATADFERNTYTLDQHRPSDPDFETRAIVVGRAKNLKQQANRTLWAYIRSKLKLEKRGNPYGASIARAMDSFYAAFDGAEALNGQPDGRLDERVDGVFGARVIRVCEALGRHANFPKIEPLAGKSNGSGKECQGTTSVVPQSASNEYRALAPEGVPLPVGPTILLLGGTGFIGNQLLRQLIAAGHAVRALVRSAAAIPADLRASPLLELMRGDLSSEADLAQAMQGIETVFHLARANVKSWADYQTLEIDATRRVAECALTAGVRRFIYTGTIDSYYCGGGAGTITEATPLDAKIHRRNLYARAKAASEEILLGMHRERALPLVIVRPGVVIGRGGSPFHWGVGMWWNEAVCQTWGDGNNKLALVLVEDVASGLIAAMNAPGIEGSSFNLVSEPLLTAQEYLDALDAAGGMRIQRHATPILRFYAQDMMKWAVKVAVRHPERRMPSYRDWESRTGRARFDCSAAKNALGWRPCADREEMVRLGISEPFEEFMR